MFRARKYSLTPLSSSIDVNRARPYWTDGTGEDADDRDGKWHSAGPALAGCFHFSSPNIPGGVWGGQGPSHPVTLRRPFIMTGLSRMSCEPSLTPDRVWANLPFLLPRYLKALTSVSRLTWWIRDYTLDRSGDSPVRDQHGASETGTRRVAAMTGAGCPARAVSDGSSECGQAWFW